jgi:hypothetical protein
MTILTALSTIYSVNMPHALTVVAAAVFGGLALTEMAPRWDFEFATVALGTSVSKALQRGRGRPRKFAAPSRAVTLTLPDAVIQRLSSLHEDLSRAVVGLVQRLTPASAKKPAELLVFGKRAVITIRPTPSLEKRAGVQLVPLPDGRALISFERPKTLADLELTINDALEDPALNGEDRRVFEGISTILRDARHSKTVSLQRRNIIVLESVPRGTSTNGDDGSDRS